MPMRQLLKKTQFFWIAFFVLGGTWLIIFVCHYRFNITGSMPIGIYQRVDQSALKIGEIVSVCLPDEMAEEGKERDYLLSGQCAHHTKPILKEIIALPGDTVTVTDLGLYVNQKFYVAPELQEDHNYLPIRRWTKNKTYHDIKTVWLYGANDSRNSWDSRYFGGVPIKNILGVYRIIWALPVETALELRTPADSQPQTRANILPKPHSHLAPGPLFRPIFATRKIS